MRLALYISAIWTSGFVFAWALLHVGTRDECDECGGVTSHAEHCAAA